MKKIKKYIIALTNLYGQVPADKVVEIYNMQNEDQINSADIEYYFTVDLSRDFIYFHKGHFVHEAILEFDEFELMLKKKADKPYYIPEKDELLKYIDEGYFENSRHYRALVKYIAKHFFKGDEIKAELLCEDIRGLCQVGIDMQTILDMFNDRGISFNDIDQVNEVLRLVMDLSNNIRIWENNGHTPNEIFEKFEKPNLRPLPDKPFDFGGIGMSNATNVIDIRTKEKIGRNEPCPCGSGKKYKKCCGR